MKIYQVRKNFTSFYLEDSKSIRGKLAFKTRETDWLNTEFPVVALISTHSAFHEGNDGDLKMDAFMGTIKNHVKGKITVLIADTAHYHTQNEDSIESGRKVAHRYQSFFEGCNILYWHSSISHADLFAPSLAKVEHLAQADPLFREHLLADAEATYTKERREKFPNQPLFLENAMKDILGQCASLFVLVSLGNRYQFYPGSPYRSVEYVNHLFFPIEKKIHWINVFLTIEKKTYSNTEILQI